MSEKLLIAKFKDGLIKYSEYQESIHREIYCPFCDPPVRITYNVKGFFMAWKNKGGHNCGKARGQANYLDPDWKGRRLTEIFRNEKGELEITIDINALVHPKTRNTEDIKNNIDGLKDNRENDIFPIYKYREEIFRDVVRSVYQMKRILENNEHNILKSLNFRFRTNDGVLSLNDAIIKIHELNRDIVGKSRFVIFMVNNSILNNEIMYINAYSVGDINLTVKLNYPYNKNPFRKLEKEFAIAYGRITYSEKSSKYFLTISNDFQIRKLKEDVGSEFFNDVEFQEYDYNEFLKRNENTKIIRGNENIILERNKLNFKNRITINTDIKIKDSDNSNAKNISFNKTISESDILEKINQTERKVQEEISNKQYRITEDLDKNSKSLFSGVKGMLKNFFKKN